MDELLDRLTRLAAEAEQAFDASAAGRSVCALHKRGATTNRLKYCEGRDYAARRLLKAARSATGKERLEQVLNELERKNRAIKSSPILSGADWQASADGVLSLVAEVRILLEEMGEDDRQIEN